MDILNKTSTEKPRNLWKDNIVDDKYQRYVTISSIDSATKSEEIDDRIIYMDEIEKRKEAYGICGECNEPGTGERCVEFLNEIKSHLQIYFEGIVQCFGITQDPNTKDYAMVLYYCNDGNLRNYYLNKPENDTLKLYTLSIIAFGLLNIHNAERVHKDFHSENRPTAKELYQIIKKWDEEEVDSNSEIYSQMDEYKKIRENKLIKRSSENKPEIIKTHPQAIYTSRLLNFKNLPEPANSSDLLSSKIYSDASVTPVSECLECEI
ncbi:uncharacterized protein OCT59_020336 [Rhizophagus irregularis]|uniref:uncharacterized protein n=1 Tax=Rhizophagus irregularis TaxID=588596 RepID=UPI00332B668D|nr:hypothetical protein OCT59_020336 [Rhizophagus irregularis]